MASMGNIIGEVRTGIFQFKEMFRGSDGKHITFGTEDADALIGRLLERIKAGLKESISELCGLAEKGHAYCEGREVFISGNSQVSAGRAIVDYWESIGDWKNISRYAAYDARTVVGSKIGKMLDVTDLDSITYGTKGATVPRAVQRYASESLLRTANRVFDEAVKEGIYWKAASVITDGVPDGGTTVSTYPPLPRKERVRLGRRLISETHDTAVLAAIVTDKRFPRPTRRIAGVSLHEVASSDLGIRKMKQRHVVPY